MASWQCAAAVRGVRLRELTLVPLEESDFQSDSSWTIGPQKSWRVARDSFFTSPSADGIG